MVEYLKSANLCKSERFIYVFTKLHVFSLVKFTKVVLLDTDILVRQNVDHLFSRPALSAFRRHPSANFKDRAKIPGDHFFDSRGKQVGGINAGVVVLRPSENDFQNMMSEIQDPDFPMDSSDMPEQDYLTNYFVDQWYNLDVRFNYQLHQIAHTDRNGLEECKRLHIAYEDLSIIHFSAFPKPSSCVVESKYENMPFKNFVETAMVKSYINILDGPSNKRKRHQRDGKGKKGKGSGRGTGAIEAQLRTLTWSSAMEWFDAWTRLVKEFPEMETRTSKLGKHMHFDK